MNRFTILLLCLGIIGTSFGLYQNCSTPSNDMAAACPVFQLTTDQDPFLNAEFRYKNDSRRWYLSRGRGLEFIDLDSNKISDQVVTKKELEQLLSRFKSFTVCRTDGLNQASQNTLYIFSGKGDPSSLSSFSISDPTDQDIRFESESFSQFLKEVSDFIERRCNINNSSYSKCRWEF